MKTPNTPVPRLARIALAGAAALAVLAPPAAARDTLEIGAGTSRYSAGLPDGRSAHLRGSWALGSGTVLNAELLAATGRFDNA